MGGHNPNIQAKPLNYPTDGGKPTRLLTVAEKDDKMAKGLCFFCDKLYESRQMWDEDFTTISCEST